jgi:cysteine desulfurase
VQPNPNKYTLIHLRKLRNIILLELGYNPTMTPNSPIYLDYSATTPLNPRVLSAMLPYFNQDFGNPSSIHGFGQRGEAAVDDAREACANILNCHPGEVIFTSCGSESDNLALRGAAIAARQQRNANHILISPVEHHAVSRTADQLMQIYGFEVEKLPVDQYGQVDPYIVAKRIRPDTAVVSIIYANNEIGSINPITDIGAICRSAGVAFHTDAVQAGAYLTLDVQQLKVDMLSLGAHKFYGPKGIGALYIRKGTPLLPTQTGGGQEFGLRAGTLNVPYIVGLAAAFGLLQAEKESHTKRLIPLRDRLIVQVLEEIPEVQLTGHPSERLPNHASFVFNQVDGNSLLMNLDLAGFACSSGSACKTGSPEPSEVLSAVGFSRSWALGSLRVTLGTDTTPSHIESLCAILPGIINKLRIT